MLYKLELIYVKYSPIVISVGFLLANILAYYDIYISAIGGYIYGVSILSIGHLYNSSYAYKFCKYHRMFIHYIVINNITNIYDNFIGFPLSDRGLLVMNLILAGIFLFLSLFYHKKYGTRKS